MSENVKITAAFDGPSGFRYSGLTRVEVAGDAAVAVEAMRAVLGGARAGLGTPRAVDITVRTCTAGPASFSVYALGDDRSREKGVAVSAEEAARFGRLCLQTMGVQVRDPEPAPPSEG